jgi:hypothetical protein
MKTILPVHCCNHIARRIALSWSLCSAIYVVAFWYLASPALSGEPIINHPPSISWLPDQRSADGMFSRKYFRIWDKETTLTAASLSVDSTNHAFTDPIGIQWGRCNTNDQNHGCPSDGGYYINFPHAPGNSSDPSATVKVTVSDGTATATSSFSLRKDSAIEPPTIAGIRNEETQSGQGQTFQYGPVWFVVGDLSSVGIDDSVDENGNSTIDFEMSSDNELLVPEQGISILPVGGMGGRTFQVTVTPTFPNTGRAVITITAIDPQLNRTSTSFVLDVIGSANTAPSFIPNLLNPHPTWVEQDVTQSSTATYNFQVTDAESIKSQLLVTAVSSNASIVPNNTAHLTIGSLTTGGGGTLTITPVLPLPSPSPGVP